MMLLVKIPVPLLSTVLVVKDIVGLAVVLQQIPLAVIVAPLSDVIFPPLVAVVPVIADAAVVVNVGNVAAFVVNTLSAP
jgi:hypothetical protein